MPFLPTGEFDSNTISVSASGAGSLVVSFTENGLTAPIGLSSFLSSLTTNQLQGSVTSVTLETRIDSGNGFGIPGTGIQLDMATFTSSNQTQSLTSIEPTGAGPYSIQEIYHITFGGSGTANLTVDLTQTPVPEPASLALLGAGLLGLQGRPPQARRIRKRHHRGFKQQLSNHRRTNRQELCDDVLCLFGGCRSRGLVRLKIEP